MNDMLDAYRNSTSPAATDSPGTIPLDELDGPDAAPPFTLPPKGIPMFASSAKAIVALVGALIYLANTYLGWNLGISEEALNTIIAVLMPALVWLVPNKRA